MYNIFYVDLTESTFIVTSWLFSIIMVTFVFQILCKQFLIVYCQILTLKMRDVFNSCSWIALSCVDIIVFLKLLSKIPMHFLIDVSVIKVLQLIFTYLLLNFCRWSFLLSSMFWLLIKSLATLKMLSVSDSWI